MKESSVPSGLETSSRKKDISQKTNFNRVPIRKTYKLYIGGKFPRSESGRYYIAEDGRGKGLANVCRASRKDLRDAVLKARGASSGWMGCTAYSRSQILYRIAEMTEGRATQFQEEFVSQGIPADKAKKEVAASVDRLVYYAGWCDKYQQIFSSVNPVASSHFNFTVPEPTGVVCILAPQESSPLLGFISVLAPCIAGANTAVILADQKRPLCAVSLAEVLHSSDLPGGVVNILTGFSKEILPQMASHMDVNAMVYCGDDPEEMKSIHEAASDNMKRVVVRTKIDWYSSEQAETPYWILDTQEKKTTWHPIEKQLEGESAY